MTIDEIKAANRTAGYFFFSPDTMQFFGSRILPTVYQGQGGIYFVTSEKKCFDDYTRVFTVRRFFPESGDIETVGEFARMTEARAKTAARKFSNGEIEHANLL